MASSDPTKYMEELLKGIDGNTLIGQQFIISFDSEGKPRVNSLKNTK